MKNFNLKPNVTILATILTASILMPHVVSAAPGTIATQPLQTSASAESNIMFVLDSSGSMQIISPDTFTHTFTCSNTNSILDSTKDITLDIDSNEPEILYRTDPLVDANSRPLGNSGASAYCFDPTKIYTVRLNTSTGGYGYVEYDGDYLNWYFDSTNDGTANWVNYKPTARTRMTVAQKALNALLDTLKSVNVGLSTFAGSSQGADFDVPIAAINTSSHLATLKAAVTATTPSGGTPLAETLRDIGRYFANGDGNNGSTDTECGGAAGAKLTIHADDFATNASPVAGLKEDVDCDGFFSNDGDNNGSEDYTIDSVATGSGPIEFFCQKNFAIMLTDGFPTSDASIYSKLKDYDQDCTVAAEIAGSYNCDSSDDTKDNDNATLDYDYWDDVAQALYEIDLRPDLNNQDGSPRVNNLVTYTVGFADKQIKDLKLIKDTAKQGGGENYYAADSADLEKILNDLNAEIEGKSGTAAAVTFNSSTLSSQSAVYQALFNTQRWSGQLRSIPLDGFTGDVKTDTCTEAVALAGTMVNCWDAEAKLDVQTARTIITYNPISKQGVDFVFTAPTTATIADYTNLISDGASDTSEKIPLTMIDDLCASHDIPFPCNASTALDSVKIDANFKYMEDLVAYLRGDRTHEAKATTRDFRKRGHVLGDIVNSSPVYVGKPSLGWPATTPFPEYPVLASGPDYTYNTWSNSSVKDRVPVVYVAANDGMLHGFRTLDSKTTAPAKIDSGEEVLAFIPSSTAGTTNTSGLHYLANPNYLHNFYVDLNPALSDVYINHRDGVSGTPTSTKAWRTVLVGGQGAGGNTMFMLDVTEPGQKNPAGTTGSTFDASNAKELIEWEFSPANLGYTYSKPTIAMMNNGRFAAVFGNGYNSNEFGGDCKAKLFVVFLDGGIDGDWTDPGDYLEIDTAIGSVGDCNGLSTPALVDLNGDSVADKAYAGDVHGNLWAFDLCNEAGTGTCQATGWGLAATTPSGTPIMTAQNDSSQRQPITVKPVVSLDPSTTGNDNLIIAFGTGQYMASGDIGSSQVQSFYGIRHQDAFTDGGSFGLDPRANGDKIKEQVITEQACTQAGCIGDVRVITNNSLNSSDNGWYIDFNFDHVDGPANGNDGERIVVNPKIRNNTLFFNTVIPDSTTCNAGGNGWLMSINLENGGRPLKPVFDLNNDGLFDTNDQEGSTNPAGQKVFAIPAESTFLGDNQYTPDSEGNISKRKVNIGNASREGRMSWKELFEDL